MNKTSKSKEAKGYFDEYRKAKMQVEYLKATGSNEEDKINTYIAYIKLIDEILNSLDKKNKEMLIDLFLEGNEEKIRQQYTYTVFYQKKRKAIKEFLYYVL